MISITLHPEYIGSLGQLRITNTFLTTIVINYLVVLTLIGYSLVEKKHNLFTSAVYYSCRKLLLFLDQFTQNRKLTITFFPLVATLFIFILVSNLVELFPGFSGAIYRISSGQHVPLLRSPSSDLTTTLALSIVAVFAVQYYTYKALGLSGLFRRFFNPAGVTVFILGLFDLLSECIKVISFSFRLFGNLFAGEVILLVSAMFAPFFIPLPFMVMELFVGIIQAFIFALLTLTFIIIAGEDTSSLAVSKDAAK